MFTSGKKVGIQKGYFRIVNELASSATGNAAGKGRGGGWFLMPFKAGKKKKAPLFIKHELLPNIEVSEHPFIFEDCY